MHRNKRREAIALKRTPELTDEQRRIAALCDGPLEGEDHHDEQHRTGYAICIEARGAAVRGMSYRDAAALAVLPSLVAGGEVLDALKFATKTSGRNGLDVTAEVAYAYADAMLRAREKRS
ncbi:hypothetical protein [Ramlibacter sp.]|uniref:hypothetical protein n=1 Tax=Ramlibacter sp. TaxID=1917967 RepID=UPI003D0B2D68